MTYCADYLWTAHGGVEAAELPLHSSGRARWALPGIPNIHSHAFQRAMAGMAERAGPGEDSFWTWREAMYACAQRMDPERLRAVAAHLYAEMLEAGFTWVCEFHYLHHQRGGRAHAPPEAMALALIEAATEAGIGLTLLPVLYQRGGFDGRDLDERQLRFGHDTAAFLKLLDALTAHQGPRTRIGVAFHSLRAVSIEAIREVLESCDPAQPLHIHVSEQVGEVQDCLAAHKARPVDLLFDQIGVDARWTLVHATHLSAVERTRIARSGAVVALCPTTEANLGDGLFPLREYLSDGGRFGIGSDSQISVSPTEELRWLEYGQRLHSRRRNRAALSAGESSGEVLLGGCLSGGWRAAGLETAPEGDVVVLDENAPVLVGARPADLVDRFVFAGNRSPIREVFSDGRRVVEQGRHVDRETIAADFRRVMAEIHD